MTALEYVRRSKESGARTVSLEDQQARIAEYEADTATGFIVTAVEGLAAEHYRRVPS
jgi:hypothetical protein